MDNYAIQYMGITKTEKGWKVDIRPTGKHGKRIRKTFDSKAEALRFAAYQKTQFTLRPDWEPPKKDRRPLKDLANLWFQLHGKDLKDGRNRLKCLYRTIEGIGNPTAHQVTTQHFTHYRAARREAGASANTVNHELAYLRALFNELERLGEWSAENPFQKIKRLKTDDIELSYLNNEEIRTLLAAIQKGKNPKTIYVTKVCLATGARWSEAETLRAEQVQPYRVSYWETKNGKGRTVPISKKLYDEIKIKKHGKLFSPCYQSFQNAVKRSGLNFPDRQMTHILRHTFASHFMMNGGNILSLQRILGHANLTMTMRYAHLAPEHLEEAVRLNPLDKMQ